MDRLTSTADFLVGNQIKKFNAERATTICVWKVVKL